jgi:pre-mRNA-processing factor SLU7
LLFSFLTEKEKGKPEVQTINAGLQRNLSSEDPEDPRAVVAATNLRSREDTAKYLHNLDIDSAHYDPKSRSMRENPYAGTDLAPEEMPFRGDNESIFTGDTREFYHLQRYAWEQYGAVCYLKAHPAHF